MEWKIDIQHLDITRCKERERGFNMECIEFKIACKIGG